MESRLSQSELEANNREQKDAAFPEEQDLQILTEALKSMQDGQLNLQQAAERAHEIGLYTREYIHDHADTFSACIAKERARRQEYQELFDFLMKGFMRDDKPHEYRRGSIRNDERTATCPVCIERAKYPRALLPCDHQYCLACIDQMVQARHTRCAMCRR